MVVAATAAEVKKTRHTRWVQTGLYLSYEIVFPSLHPHYAPAPVLILAFSLIPSYSMSDMAVKDGGPLILSLPAARA